MKRPPASPATAGAGCGRTSDAEGSAHKVGNTPIRSPDPKKARTDELDDAQPTDALDAHVETLLSSASSPMAPPMNLTQDVLERETPEPLSLEDAFDETMEVAASMQYASDNFLYVFMTVSASVCLCEAEPVSRSRWRQEGRSCARGLQGRS